MNKAELINVIADRANVSKKQAEDMVHAFVDIVTETLNKREEVTIAGFGAWSAKTRASRMGVNPQNPTEKIRIPEVIVPKFKAGKGLKDALKGKRSAPVESETVSVARPESPAPSGTASPAMQAPPSEPKPTAPSVEPPEQPEPPVQPSAPASNM